MAKSSAPDILALVTDAFGGQGGIALYMRDVLRCLASLSPAASVTLLARIGETNGSEIPKNVDWKTEALNGKFAYFKCLAKLLMRKQQPGLVVCGHINLLPLARLAAWRARSPLVLFIYGIDAWRAPKRLLARNLIPSIDLVLAISEVTRGRFLSWSGLDPCKVALAPNAIKLEQYAEGPPNPELVARYGLEGKRVLLTLGRLVSTQRHKGVDELMAVLPELLKQFPDLIYLVAGGGDDISRLQTLAQQLEVDGNVVFTGFVAESEKADHYRLADAFALTGFGDGFGFVLLEAMACGIPVAASELDGSREAVRNGQLGVLVDPGDASSLLNGMTEVLTRSKGIPSGLEYFAYPNFCRRLKGAIRPLLEVSE